MTSETSACAIPHQQQQIPASWAQPAAPAGSLATVPYAAAGSSVTSLRLGLPAILKPWSHHHRWENKTRRTVWSYRPVMVLKDPF